MQGLMRSIHISPNTEMNRYWNSRFKGSVKPSLHIKDRASIILRKYCQKLWTPDKDDWPLVLQREHPLTALETRVLETVERKKALRFSSTVTVTTREEPVKVESSKSRSSKGRKKRCKASDASWDEVIYDGKSIVIGDQQL